MPGVLTAVDHTRVDAMKTLLGNGFTLTGTAIAVDKTSRAHIGAAATFTATTGGGSVSVEWSTVQRPVSGNAGAESGAVTSKEGTSKEGTGGQGNRVSGAVLVVGNTEWDAKILQGRPGSTPILATKTAASTFLGKLAAASS